MTRRPPRRRTQAERKEATVARLLAAATEALIAVGYAGASVQQICSRAGLSHGALFRHFPTTEALMAAVGQSVGPQLMVQYQKGFSALSPEEATIETALRMLQRTCRSRLNQAWYELALAARTDPALARALKPVAQRYYDDIAALAAGLLPDLTPRVGPAFPVLVRTVLAVFDADVVQRVAGRSAAGDEQQVQLLAAAVRGLARAP